MNKYTVTNILDLMDSIGAEEVETGLSGFSCPINEEIENFIHKNAIEFAKRKLSTSAFLLAQIGKNYSVDNGMRITGSELIGYVNYMISDIQRRIGGGIIYLDCEDKECLRRFYIEKNHYKIFGVRYSSTDNIRYLQMIRFC
ncbi:MAG: hypothetical protein HFH58_06295 [Lachnospiraceae bacterium]|jgi:hypothetical protein|nr:hypothetical protein [Lachnospiraceae bacterium]